jgi:hypothetical protein
MQMITHATHKNSRNACLRDFEKVACPLTQLTHDSIGVRECVSGDLVKLAINYQQENYEMNAQEIAKPRFEFYTVAELMALPLPTVREEIIDLLRVAAKILERSPHGDHDDSAAWRIADAGLMLGRKIRRSGARKVVGVHVRTGRGALLPKEPKS